jgi:Na+-driven multidrug efflux pump
MDHGVMGAAMASNVTSFVSCVLLITYISRCPDFAEAWYLPTMQTIKGMGEYLSLAIPGTIMMFVEALSL